MAATISLELLTPQKVAAQIDVSEATLPGSLGQFTVLPDHAPYVAQLKPGVLRYTSGEGVQSAVVIGSGFAEVVDNRLLVL
ncbi:MAG: F0F1 ATP synthase subunit epsilon, partial [Anaerolineae bacterium]|nr:F0F1 ATP synthase subunit epsilon [Anaerolineae bacterium]